MIFHLAKSNALVGQDVCTKMTHFITLILVPNEVMQQGPAAVKQYINNTMAKYSEYTEVEPHVVLTKVELRAEYKKYKLDHDDCEYNDEKEYAKEWHSYDIDDDGNAVSNFNDDSFYDWYVVGGRWDGVLTGNEQHSQNGFNFGEQHHTVQNNSIPVSTLLEKAGTVNDPDEDWIFHCIVDGDGTVHQSKLFGWFGMYVELQDEDQWNQQYFELLDKHKNSYNVVTLDCHV